jgi:5-methylcytosine-specific restriction endonuclease McrA
MKTTLKIDITVKDICEGFFYSELEGKGLFGLSGKLTIQPEYQRAFIYASDGGKKEAAVIESVLNRYPLGLIYFNKVAEDKFEVLDGQQRITSLGRFITGKFAVKDDDGNEQYFSGMAKDKRDRILETKLTIYECEGKESEIKKWFETINIVGVPLNKQELLNAIFSGPFVTLAKAEFSNSQNANIQKWSAFVSGSAIRQDFLECALDWVSKGDISGYMSQHRKETNIKELKTYFNTVIDWVAGVFPDVESEMCGLEWGRLYETYHKKAYDPAKVSVAVQKLYEDSYVSDKKGIFEFILGGSKDTKLLNVRVFNEATKKSVYATQTKKAKAEGKSNCPHCAIGHDANKSKVWELKDMDADHVTAWSKGGGTNEKNCQMLCKTHNRAKGNR